MRNQESHKKIEEDLILSIQDKTDVQNMVTPSTEKGLGVQQASTSVRFVINLATSVTCIIRKQMACKNTKGDWTLPGHTN